MNNNENILGSMELRLQQFKATKHSMEAMKAVIAEAVYHPVLRPEHGDFQWAPCKDGKMNPDTSVCADWRELTTEQYWTLLDDAQKILYRWSSKHDISNLYIKSDRRFYIRDMISELQAITYHRWFGNNH